MSNRTARPAGGLARVYRLLRPALPFVLASALLAALVLRVDARATWDELKGADPAWIPLVLAANYVSDWFRAVRWQHLLSPVGRPAVSLLFLASQVGSAVNLVVPLRPGEAVRVRIVSQRSGVSASSLVATLFGEVLSDIVTFSTYVVAGLLLLDEARFLWPVAVVFGVLLAAGLPGSYWLARRVERWPDPDETARPGLRARVEREFYHFGHGLRSVRDTSASFNIIWSAQATWLCEAFAFYACGRALGIDLSVGGYLLLVVAANVAGSVPLTQAGIGVFEVTLVGLMVALGVDKAQAAAYAIFVHVLLTVPHVISGPLAALALRVNPFEVLMGAKKS